MIELDNERARLDPPPDILGSRESESQLGQLLRWIAWASNQSIKVCYVNELKMAATELYKRLDVGGANNEFVADLMVWFQRQLNIPAPVAELRALSALPKGGTEWHETARLIRAVYLAHKGPLEEHAS